MRQMGRFTLTLAFALAVCGVNGAIAEGPPASLGTASIKVAFNFLGECSVTNYNSGTITVDFIRVFDSNGVQRASATNLTIDSNETAKIAFSGLNDRYHCVAGGFRPSGSEASGYCESVDLAKHSRLLLDALFNGSSTAESEGELITPDCKLIPGE